MSTETAVVLAELREIRSHLEQINRRLSEVEVGKQFEPRVVTYERASVLLSQKLTKTKQMVRDGELETVTVGRKKLIPMSEIERLATPLPKHQTVAQAKVAARWVPITKKKR